MTINDGQFSVRFLAVGLTVLGCYLGLVRLLFETAILSIGLVFFLFWFALSFFLMTRPTEFDPVLRKNPGPRMPLRWRLAGSCIAGMVFSLVVMIWATYVHD